ncbi:Uncharacterised protein [Acinetobacter baumannii]|nr:Uncharacterised protein [Acinetobacter baumannii]
MGISRRNGVRRRAPGGPQSINNQTSGEIWFSYNHMRYQTMPLPALRQGPRAQVPSRKRSGSTSPAAMAMPTSSGRVWACMRFITRAR